MSLARDDNFELTTCVCALTAIIRKLEAKQTLLQLYVTV